ncbi:hypothetical protein K227x_19700 [Rubripirellula lacrimiformis]|uniref:Uncharacterized protein n=1 Tax=Rubripirellula lacrimiformis TaxID=1930273 RepID=A0A517N8X4_9BACT|nr:hypothetical protein [Rubripirellula lacrimiformis]QDT03586.1 hypothetical protein K227x_19700 [Rubripirellula lacrimiformis]
MIGDDLDELYKLLRGSRSANPVLDARALAQEGRFTAAREKLIDARESYMESRSRLMKQDPEKQFAGKGKDDVRNRKVLARKQEKTREILKSFEELMPRLERMAKREEAAKIQINEEPVPASAIESDDHLDDSADAVASDSDGNNDAGGGPDNESNTAEDPSSSAPVMLATATDLSESFLDSFASGTDDQRMDLINDQFGFREVLSDDDIYPTAVYFIRTGDDSYLVQTSLTAASDDAIEAKNLADPQALKPFTRKGFVKLGQQRMMVLLTKQVSLLPPGSDHTSGGSDQRGDHDSDDIDFDDTDGQQNVLDMGAFGQLMSAAQRSGLVSSADQIGHVRDREFRLGKYDLAFAAIDALYSRFNSDANQRTQQLAREEMDISTGKVKISPKDLQIKRTRDRMQTQEVDRAKRRFQVVLEGLRRLTAGADQ